MTSNQRTIKYIAMGLAIALSVFLISIFIRLGVFFLAPVIGNNWNRNTSSTATYVDNQSSFSNIKEIQIDTISDIYVKEGNGLEIIVEATDVPDSYEAKVDGETLVIKMNSTASNFFFRLFQGNNPLHQGKIVITVPKGLSFASVDIQNAVGEITIEDLKTEELHMETGTGDITVSDTTVSYGKADTGVGDIKFNNSYLNDFDINNGVGDVKFEGKLTGECSVDAGVGDVSLRLEGTRNEYNFDLDSGIGSAKIDGDKVARDYDLHQGARNTIEIDAGVGDVDIRFE